MDSFKIVVSNIKEFSLHPNHQHILTDYGRSVVHLLAISLYWQNIMFNICEFKEKKLIPKFNQYYPLEPVSLEFLTSHLMQDALVHYIWKDNPSAIELK